MAREREGRARGERQGAGREGRAQRNWGALIRGEAEVGRETGGEGGR